MLRIARHLCASNREVGSIYPELVVIEVIAAYAAFGGFLGAAIALATGQRYTAGDWLVRGTVGGGMYGVIRVIVVGIN